MKNRLLPHQVTRVVIPPVKCQGIKTKLVNFILTSISWDGKGRWIEPFLGSGVILFNLRPEHALVSDTNPHIINFYQKIQNGKITASLVKEFLTDAGEQLNKKGEDYYYYIRDRFNKNNNTLDFIFLNRSCFNGVMRFNKKGEFNVPFCQKPDRFRQAYVTKIANQIKQIREIALDKDWIFKVSDWRECLKEANRTDFIYLDPPYIGRHTNYFDMWSDNDAIELAKIARSLPCGFALSMWKENKYRFNSHVTEHWNWTVERVFTHFYHVGSTENLRNSMDEALLIKPDYEVPIVDIKKPNHQQLAMQLDVR